MSYALPWGSMANFLMNTVGQKQGMDDVPNRYPPDVMQVTQMAIEQLPKPADWLPAQQLAQQAMIDPRQSMNRNVQGAYRGAEMAGRGAEAIANSARAVGGRMHQGRLQDQRLAAAEENSALQHQRDLEKIRLRAELEPGAGSVDDPVMQRWMIQNQIRQQQDTESERAKRKRQWIADDKIARNKARVFERYIKQGDVEKARPFFNWFLDRPEFQHYIDPSVEAPVDPWYFSGQAAPQDIPENLEPGEYPPNETPPDIPPISEFLTPESIEAASQIPGSTEPLYANESEGSLIDKFIELDSGGGIEWHGGKPYKKNPDGSYTEADVRGPEEKSEEEAFRQGLYAKNMAVLDEAKRSINLLDENPEIGGAAGLVGQYVPESAAWKLSDKITAIKANIGLDKLQDIRRLSPNGGAVGQVSDYEQHLLQSAMGAIGMGMGTQELKRALARYYYISDAILNPEPGKLERVLNHPEFNTDVEWGPYEMRIGEDITTHQPGEDEMGQIIQGAIQANNAFASGGQ
jgi:hypothetical protein